MYNKTNIVFLIILLFFIMVCADRGVLRTDDSVKVFKPRQRVILSWNGISETLILSTDIYSNKNTRIIEILPFKNRPEVKYIDKKLFSDMTFLINREMYLKNVLSVMDRERGLIPDDVEVVFNKLTDVKDNRTFYIDSIKGFISSVKDYLSKDDDKNIDLDEKMLLVIRKYLKKGFRYFVFDRVDLTEDIVSTKCIQYKFKSDELYYPMFISSTDSGTTEVEMTIITKGLLHYFPEMKESDILLLHKPLDISVERLKEVSNDIYYDFKEDDKVRIRLWNIKGELSDLKKDIVAK